MADELSVLTFEGLEVRAYAHLAQGRVKEALETEKGYLEARIQQLADDLECKVVEFANKALKVFPKVLFYDEETKKYSTRPGIIADISFHSMPEVTILTSTGLVRYAAIVQGPREIMNGRRKVGMPEKAIEYEQQVPLTSQIKQRKPCLNEIQRALGEVDQVIRYGERYLPSWTHLI